MNVKSLTKSVSFSLTELYKLSTGSDEEQEKIAKDIQNRITEVPKKRFENLSELLTWCNITPKEFSKRTGYDHRTVISWVKGGKIPERIKEDVLSITVSRSPKINGYWEEVRLMGAKSAVKYGDKVLTLDEKTARLGKKSRRFSRYIIEETANQDNFFDYCFLKK